MVFSEIWMVKGLFELILFSQLDGFDSVQHEYYRKKHLEYLLPEGDEAHLSKHSPFGKLRCWTLIMSLYVSPQNLGFPGSCGLLAPRYGSQLKEGEG